MGKSKVCVYADSVQCVGQMKDSPGAIERWKGRVEGLRLYSSYQDEELYFECRKSQELRDEMLARTLDILGSRVGRDVVWKFFSRSKKEWDSTVKKLTQLFKETGHLLFKSISALSRGILKQRNGKSTIHFNGDSMNTELFFQTIHSVNRLSGLWSSGELVSSIRV